MTVAVQRGIESMARQLRGFGYDVVSYGAYPYAIDAVVYVNGDSGLQMRGAEACGADGILYVNATGKTPAEVDEILKRRLYSPLF